MMVLEAEVVTGNVVATSVTVVFEGAVLETEVIWGGAVVTWGVVVSEGVVVTGGIVSGAAVVTGSPWVVWVEFITGSVNVSVFLVVAGAAVMMLTGLYVTGFGFSGITRTMREIQ